MADNVTLDAGAGGDTIAADEIAGAKYQRNKLIHGADGVNAGDVSLANGLPVQPATSAAFPVTDNSGSITVDAPVGTPVFVRLSDGSAAISTLPVSIAGTVAVQATNLQVNLNQLAGGGVNVGNGASGAGVLRVAQVSDGTGVLAGVTTVSAVTSITNALPAGDNNIGNVDIVTVPADPFGANADAASATGSISAKLRFIASTGVPITGTVTVGSHAVTNAGTFAVQVDGTALTRLTDIETNTDSGAVVGNGAAATAQRVTLANDSTGVIGTVTTVTTVSAVTAITNALPAGTNNIGDVDVLTLPNVTLAAGTNTNEVVGDAAHGAAVAGNPLLVGLEGRSTAPTAVDDGDVVRALATLLGKQVQLPYALPGSTWSYATATAGVTDTADDEAKAAVASTRNYVTSVQVINGHATVATEVVIKDGSAVLWRGWAEAVGGGVSAKFDPPLRGTANTAINVANITTGSKTYFNLQGFTATE